MFVETHIIQNFAPSCLNRDDTNSPKDCEFGGYRRARISSQCIKRAARKYFVENKQALKLDGKLATRSKRLLEQVADALVASGKKADDAKQVARFVIENAGFKMDEDKTSVLLFFGADDVERLKSAIATSWGELTKAVGAGGEAAKKAKRGDKSQTAALPDAVKKAIQAFKDTKAIDVALFGRMVAESTDLSVDGACQVAHAISTNQVSMEMDFYTAVDDLQPKEDTGAGMMGIVEFNSSCFYRYALVDTRQLADNLGGDSALARDAVLAFLDASIKAIPTGRQNSMAAQNLPVYVRIIVRDASQPRSLANAFLAPVRPKADKDIALVSIEKLEKHGDELNKMYGSDGIALDIASSTYEGHGSKTVPELLKAVKEVLK